MGKGKIAAQCCHAAVGVVMDLCEEPAGYALMMQWVRCPAHLANNRILSIISLIPH